MQFSFFRRGSWSFQVMAPVSDETSDSLTFYNPKLSSYLTGSRCTSGLSLFSELSEVLSGIEAWTKQCWPRFLAHLEMMSPFSANSNYMPLDLRGSHLLLLVGFLASLWISFQHSEFCLAPFEHSFFHSVNNHWVRTGVMPYAWHWEVWSVTYFCLAPQYFYYVSNTTSLQNK